MSDEAPPLSRIRPTDPSGDDAAEMHFDRTHQVRDDPWGVTSRWYEIRKRALTLASLPDRRYRSALEIGCSIGVFTEELAGRVDRLTATDLSAEAVARARERVAHLGHVTVLRQDAAAGLPDGAFDLVILSEVGYYLDPEALAGLIERIEVALEPGGVVVACHWRRDESDFLQTTEEVHGRLAASSAWERLVHHVEEDFLLDVYSTDARSVAGRTGLA